ncbi:MAG TPA: zinc ribbon domain-containing protein, partial [Blastocatellia bacterium]
MNQICQHCSYQSPSGARFCRQCGAQLLGETEFSAAETRNYVRQESAPAVATAGSGPLPPSVADAIAGETARYYQASYVPVPMASDTSQIKSRIRHWRIAALPLALFIGVTIGGAVTGIMSHTRDSRTPEERERARIAEAARRSADDARRRQDDARRRAQDLQRQAEDRARQAMDRAREAVERSREASERAIEAGDVIAPTDEKPLDLSQYEYPGATTSSVIRIPGREMITMRLSKEQFDAVNQFYQKKLDKPIVEINQGEEKRLIFQSKTAPSIAVSVETDFSSPGPPLKIVVLRS